MSKIVLSLVLLAVFALCAAQNNNFNLGANVNNGQWNVNGAYNRNFNGGSFGVNGNVGSGGQWGVGGQYQRSWNNGNTNLGLNGGYNNGAGWNAGLQFTHRWDDIEESDAQFFKDWMKKAGSWLKNPENLQKVVDVYRTVRSDEADEEEADFSLPSWANWENAQKALQVYQMLRRDQEDDEEADFSLPSWVNWENAQKAIQVYQMFRRDQDDEADEESDAEFIKSVWKKVGPIAKELGKNYLRSKGIPLQDDEESDFSFKKLWGKIRPIATELGKNYLRSKGIPLQDDEDALSDEISSWQGQAAANWAWSQIGKGYSQSARYGPSSFDCSGLINRAYASVGVNVPTSTYGYPGGMRRVSESEMRAGDILYKSGHVAMYAGNGQVVHAANSRLGVVSIPFNNFKSWWGFSAIYRP